MSILWRVRFISVLGKLGKIELAKKVVDISLNQGYDNSVVNLMRFCRYYVASRASKVTGRGLQGSGLTRDNGIAAKASRQVLNPKAVTEFNPTALFQKKKLNVVSKDKPKSTVEKASDVVSDKPVVKKSVNAPVVAAVESVVEKDNPKVMSKVSDKPSSVVGKDKDKAKNIAPRLSKQKENPEFKAKVNVKRKMILSKEDDNKKKFKGKSKKDVSDSELETDVVDEADRKISKRKKLKRERSDSDSSDSSELDRNIIKRLISKLEKKVKKEESDDSVPKKVKKKLTKRVKKEESDEDTVPQKGKKKEKQLTPEEAAHEKYLSSFPPFHARTTPSSLFSAIRNSRVDILGFLTDIGFSSLYNVSIDHLPLKLGWFAVSNFKNYMLSFDSGDKIEVTPSKIHDMLGVPIGGYSLFDLDERETDHEFVSKWASQFYPLELKKVRVNDIARKLVAAQEIDFLFKVNFLTLFTNTMAKADGLKGQICLDVVRRLREDSVISDINWCGYIYDSLRDSKLPGGTNHYLGPLTFLILLYLDSTKFDKFLVVRTRPAIRNWSSYLMKQRQELELKDHVLGLLDLHDDWNEAEVQESEGFIGFSKTSEKEALFKRAEEKLAAICSERVFLEDLMRKASSAYPGDGKFVELQAKYVQVFRDPISFDVDMDVVNESNGDDDNDNDGDGNGDEEDANDGDENGSNPSFGFSKISLDDFGNDIGPTEKESVDPVDPAEQEIVVEGDPAEECQIMSTPENYTQWLEKNLDLVGEGDLFGDNSATRELMNKGPVTSERMPTPKASPIAKKRVVKPSPYMLSPYMNKKTNVVPKITRSEFILGNSVFAMQGDKIESVFETHSGEYSVYGLRLNMETLAPGLWIDANVIDCWGAILNHEERFRVADSKSRHFFPTGCITKSMFDGTFATDEAKWDSFSNQVKSQFGGNVDGLALQGIDL
ncbi:hypothetical protein Tco_0816617, partial [Tanacetum coccineum]